MSCGEYNVISLYFLCWSVNESLCIVCLTVFGEAIRNMFGCGCSFVVECYGGVESEWR